MNKREKYDVSEFAEAQFESGSGKRVLKNYEPMKEIFRLIVEQSLSASQSG